MNINPDLIDGVARHAEHPETFELPSEETRSNLRVGDYVKIGLGETSRKRGERFWTKVLSAEETHYVGRVENDLLFHDFVCGDTIEFLAKHVLCEPVRFETDTEETEDDEILETVQTDIDLLGL